MRFLLDTNIVSQAMRAHAGVLARLKAAASDEIAISAVTLGEIEYGIARMAANAGGRTRRAAQLKMLFEALLTYVTVAPWDRAAAERYAVARVELERKGQAIDQADLMIAAHAASIDATLVTADEALLRHRKSRTMPASANWMA